MDRPIRPLFPKGYIDEVQIQAMVLSSDMQNDADVHAMNGAAAALMISPLPFQGPIGSVRVGRIEGKLIPFPTQLQLEESDLDMIVSGNQREVVMIEGFAQEIPEAEMIEAITFAHNVIREIIDLQLELVQKVNPTKMQFTALDDSLCLLKFANDSTIDFEAPIKRWASRIVPKPRSR